MDSELDIQIRILADTHGADAVRSSLKNITEDTKKATKGYSDMAQGLKLLGREFPILGAIGRAVTNPLVAGFALLAVAIRQLNSQIKETIALLEPAEWAGRAQAIRSAKDAFKDATVSANAYWHSLQIGESAISEIISGTDRQITKIRELADAEQKVAEARKRLAIESVNTSREKGEIGKKEAEKRLRDIEAMASLKEDAAARVEENKVINALMQKRAEIITLIVNLQSNLSGAQTEAAGAEARLAQIEGERAVHTQNIANADKKIAEFDKEIEAREKFGMRSAIFDSLTDANVRSSRQTTIDSRDAARRAMGGIDARLAGEMTIARTRRAGASAMESDLTGATGARREVEREIEMQATQIDVNRSTRGRLGAFGSATRAVEAGLGIGARGLIGAAEGADIIASGGKVTGDQARMINDAAKALGLANQSTATVIRVISQLNDKQDIFDRALKQVEGRIKTVNRNPVSP